MDRGPKASLQAIIYPGPPICQIQRSNKKSTKVQLFHLSTICLGLIGGPSGFGGASAKTGKKMMDLASLVIDEDDFE